MEAQIAQVWCLLFQVEKLSVTANFFELGGHSLMVMRMLSMLRQANFDVSVTDMFSHPTIESLAALIVRQKVATSNPCAIPLRTSGGQHPLFIVHEIAGGVHYGHSLLQHIDADIPVYGLPGQLLDEIPHWTMQAYAVRLIGMIRAVQPNGPYRLAGWCFAGRLAYEIATQLIGEDEKVEFVGLIESYNNDEFTIVEEQDDIALLLEIIGNIEDDYPVEIIDEIKSDAATMDFEQLVRKCQDLSLLPPHLTATEFRKFQAHWRGRELADTSYFVYGLPIPVHLFAAEEERVQNPFREWDQAMDTSQIRMIPVKGSHMSIMKPPHISLLGKALSQAIKEASGDKGVEGRWSPLMPIQTGKPSRVPIFCVPGAGGSVTALTGLANVLDSGIPVYGLQPRGLDGDAVPHSTVPAAARCYLKAIQEAYPKGPLHLLGHSFGGWVVFEMAQQLIAIGRNVASITLVDTEVPDEIGCAIREYSEADVFMKLVEIYQQSAACPIPIDAENLTGLNANARLMLLHESLVRVGLMPRQTEPEVLRGTLRTFATALRTHYRPNAVYDGPLRLVLVRDPALEAGIDQLRNEGIAEKWRHWAPNLTYWQSQGNHMTVLKSPNVDALAAWLQLQ